MSNAGAAPVTMRWGPGVSEALNDGTLDGLIVNIDSGYDINAHTSAPNILVSPRLWLGHEYLIAMNKSVWDGLADADKDAIARAAESSYSRLGGVMDASLVRQIEVLREDGANVRIMTDEEVDFWENATDYRSVQDKWTAEDAQAAEVLETLCRLINKQYSVKSGISYSRQWGLYIANVIEKDGTVSNVVIDRLAGGKSSKELHDNYGIKPVSTLGKDWWEQVVHYERWVVEHGIDAVSTDDKGHATDPDLLSGATINVAELSDAVRNALNGTVEAGGYVIKTGTSYSSVWGLYIANVILKDGEIVKVLLDRISLQGEDSKEKYDSYGIKRVSSINKDWWEQVAHYEDWVLKNGIDAVKYDKDGRAENVDLISGATIGIDDLTLAVKDALSR